MVDTRVSIALEVKLFKMKKVFYKKNVGPVEQKKIVSSIGLTVIGIFPLHLFTFRFQYFLYI